jgi:asparagine synthase (glutamine-hydrolysing)
VADVPVGAYLSGGFDSTLVTSLAHREAGDSLQAFSIRFENQECIDHGRSMIVISNDEPFAIQAAREIGTTLSFTSVADASLAENLDRIARVNDALPAWEQEIAQSALAADASQFFRAILVGDAADETHYGYHFLLDPDICREPARIFQRLFGAPIHPRHLPDPVRHFNEKYLRLIERGGHRWSTPDQRTAAMTYLIVKRWLPRLLHNGDIHSMAHGLEARVPFADRDLLALSQRIHPGHGFHNGVEKWILRRAARGMLPESIRRRTKSALPKAPNGGTLYRRLLMQSLPESGDMLSEILEMDRLRTLLESDALPTESEQSLYFRLYCLGRWFNHYQVTWR